MPIIDSIDIRTNLGSFHLDPSAPGSAAGDAVQRFIQPAVTVTIGGVPMNYAPHGEPGPSGPLMPLLLLAIVAGIVFGAGYLMAK